MAELTEYKSESPLRINCCGIRQVNGNVGRIFREKGRVDYHIIYIIEGTLFLREKGEEIAVNKGNTILYLPDEPQDYYCKTGFDATYYYIHFTGRYCEKILSEFSLSGRVINTGLSSSIEGNFKRMIEEYYLLLPHSYDAANGYFISILAHLGRRVLSNDSDNSSSGRAGIYDALKVIAHKFHEDKDVSFYAGMCNLSISHFTHRFKAVTGKSLKEYVAYIRVEKAKELLYNTNLSVKEIAESVGYSDQNYFSRIFKKYSGESPLGYRKKYN